MITTTQKILISLVKDFSVVHTATSLSQWLKMSRWGVWKTMKKLQEEELIIIKPVGTGKTSTQTVHLNWNNKLTEKTVILALAQEASTYKRWSFNFADVESEVDFFILYGSILHSPQAARDIDVFGVSAEKNLAKISKQIFAIQKTQEKKIHSINFTQSELRSELQKPNKAVVDAIKKGIVLFGQENFTQFMKELR